MKNVLTVVLLAIILGFTSCEKAASDRFESSMIGDDKEEIIKDTETGLTWVNDVKACFGGIIVPANQCMDLTFAGESDWRTPTASEMSELILGIDAAELKLNYVNTSCAYMSTSESKWVFTENSASPGEMTTNEPGNAGLRCVRK